MTTVPGAVMNTNVDLTLEIPSQQQDYGHLLHRRIRNINQSNIYCCSCITITTIYICIFIIASITVLFTGAGLVLSKDEETYALGVRMVIGGLSSLTGSVLISCCSLSILPIIACVQEIMNKHLSRRERLANF